MTKQTLPAQSHYGWRWLLVLIGMLAWVSIGCNPQFISMALRPFDDGKVPPDYPLFAGDKEITLAIVTNFARPETNPDLQAADADLAEQVASAIRQRCKENKHKLKIVPHAQVRGQQLKQQQRDATSPVELGKSLKADFVLDLTINSLTLYEKNYHPQMYRGRADIAVNLYKVEVKDESHKVFSKEFRRIHPRDSPPIDAGSSSASSYRSLFLVKVASDISRMFIAFDEKEKKVME